MCNHTSCWACSHCPSRKNWPRREFWEWWQHSHSKPSFWKSILSTRWDQSRTWIMQWKSRQVWHWSLRFSKRTGECTPRHRSGKGSARDGWTVPFGLCYWVSNPSSGSRCSKWLATSNPDMHLEGSWWPTGPVTNWTCRLVFLSPNMQRDRSSQKSWIWGWRMSASWRHSTRRPQRLFWWTWIARTWRCRRTSNSIGIDTSLVVTRWVTHSVKTSWHLLPMMLTRKHQEQASVFLTSPPMRLVTADEHKLACCSKLWLGINRCTTTRESGPLHHLDSVNVGHWQCRIGQERKRHQEQITHSS